MAIQALLDEGELALVEILRQPVWAAEFLRNLDIDKDSKPWELAPYQTEMIADHGKYIALCCGRSVGKSESILDKVSWYMINNFFTHDPISIVTPNRVHLEPLFNKLRRWLTTHSFLKHYVARKGLNSAIFNIIALNGFQLDCRIAGTGTTGANVMGLHTPVILLDEAGIFPWPVWLELMPCLNSWMQGTQLFISGVPTGQRERNVLYFGDQVDPNFNRFNISQHQNPRYSDADEIRNQKQYGGIDTEEYIHLVLGRHGTPVYAMFDRAKMLIESYDVFVSKIYGLKLKTEPGLLADVLRLMPNAPRGIEKLAIGIDLGYCYSEDTDVLTERGWINHSKVTTKDVVACYDTDKDKIIWDNPLDTLETDYEGEMLEVSGKSTNFMVSPGHKVWAKKFKNIQTNEKYEELSAQDLTELKSARFKVKIAAKSDPQIGPKYFDVPYYYCKRKDREQKSTRVDMNLWAKFLGWFVAEGSTYRKGGWSVELTQQKERYADEIDEIMKQLPYTYQRKEWILPNGKTQVSWQITCKDLCIWLENNCGKGSKNKKIPSIIFKASTEHQKLFLDAALKGDGSKLNSDRSPAYNSISKQLLNDMHKLAITLGYSSTKSIYKDGMGRVSFMSRTENQLRRDKNIKRVDYKGKIYSLTTPTGYYVTRRKGKVAIQGNTEPSVLTGLYLKDGMWKFLFRIILYQVPYPKQQQFISELDMKYNPDFIGIDAGGPGKVVVQNLINASEYLRQQFGSRLVPIDFNASISVGFDHNGVEMKERAKIYAMQKLQEMSNNHTIMFSSADEEVIMELERTVYTRTSAGNIVYKTLTDKGGRQGDDHNLASLISFVLSWYYKYDSKFFRRPHKPLWQPRWI